MLHLRLNLAVLANLVKRVPAVLRFHSGVCDIELRSSLFRMRLFTASLLSLRHFLVVVENELAQFFIELLPG